MWNFKIAMRKIKNFIGLLLSFGLVNFTFVWSQQLGIPAVLTANHVEYNDKTEVVQAVGDVQIIKQGKVLRADVVIYHKKTGYMQARGNVWFKESTGEIYFFDTLDLTQKMEDGFGTQIKGILLDNARIVAQTGQKIGDKGTIFQKGVYSPCNVCRQNPEQAPLWQLKADKVINDKQDQTVIYHHARMEIFGFPILYSPYFWHADSSVKRKTGFLKPEYGTSTDLGKFVSIPFFINIAPNSDITLMPIFTSAQGPILTGEYRHLFEKARFDVSGSFTSSHSLNEMMPHPKSADFPSHDRWHFFVNGRIDLSEDHLLSIDINRASDTTYLRRYPVLPQGKILEARQSILTSYLALEQFKETSYGAIKSYAFQTDSSKVSPFIIPAGDYSYESMPGIWGETFSFDANVLSLHRIDPIINVSNSYFGAADMDRLSLAGAFQLPYVSPLGDLWTLKTQVRWDKYSLDDYRTSLSQTSPTGELSLKRFFPQISLNWRYPWVFYGQNLTWVIEPAAMVVLSRQGGNLYRKGATLIPFPNEDSHITTLDPTLLFAMNRFYGLDRVDSGRRVIYGGNSNFYLSGGQRLFLFAGQTFRLDRLKVLPDFSGEDKKSSNVITGIKLIPFKNISLSNRLMLDRNKLAIRLSETELSLKTPYGDLTGNHTYINRKLSPSNQRTSQLNWTLSTIAYKNIRFSYSESRNISPDRNPITGVRETSFYSRGIGMVFENECLTASFSVSRTAFRYRDIKPTTTALLVLDFKNIGSISPLSFFGDPLNTPIPINSTGR